MPDTNAIITTVICALIFLALSIKNEGFKFKLKDLGTSILPYVLSMIPWFLAYLMAFLLGFNCVAGATYFALGAFVPFCLSRLKFSSNQMSVWLFLGSVLFTSLLKSDPASDIFVLPSLIAGLATWKFTDIVCHRQERTLFDLVPALAWLIGFYWTGQVSPAKLMTFQRGFLLCEIGVIYVMRLLQMPFMHDDKIYLKRLILSCTAGLLQLIMVSKVLMAPEMGHYCWLVGGGVLVAYLLQEAQLHSEKSANPFSLLQVIILIGILATVAARLCGTFGYLVLAPVFLVSLSTGLSLSVGLFFLGRVLLQTFLNSFNTNVSGINLTHAYAGAALYGGFALACLVVMLLGDNRYRKEAFIALLATGVSVPLLSNFFLHIEPTASLLIAFLVASLLLSIAYPFFLFKPPIKDQLPEHLQTKAEPVVPLTYSGLLMPVQAIALCTVFSELFSLGNATGINERLQILSVALGLCVVLIVATWWLLKRTRRQNVNVA